MRRRRSADTRNAFDEVSMTIDALTHVQDLIIELGKARGSLRGETLFCVCIGLCTKEVYFKIDTKPNASIVQRIATQNNTHIQTHNSPATPLHNIILSKCPNHTQDTNANRFRYNFHANPHTYTTHTNFACSQVRVWADSRNYSDCERTRVR